MPAGPSQPVVAAESDANTYNRPTGGPPRLRRPNPIGEGVELAAMLRHAARVLRGASLAELYARVAAAEEEDLLEQYAEEQHEAWLRCLYAPWIDVDSAGQGQEEPDVEVQLEVPLTHAQAVELVKHLLGGRPLEDL